MYYKLLQLWCTCTPFREHQETIYNKEKNTWRGSVISLWHSRGSRETRRYHTFMPADHKLKEHQQSPPLTTFPAQKTIPVLRNKILHDFTCKQLIPCAPNTLHVYKCMFYGRYRCNHYCCLILTVYTRLDLCDLGIHLSICLMSARTKVRFANFLEGWILVVSSCTSLIMLQHYTCSNKHW